jgi:hypothetical protein
MFKCQDGRDPTAAVSAVTMTGIACLYSILNDHSTAYTPVMEPTNSQ